MAPSRQDFCDRSSGATYVSAANWDINLGIPDPEAPCDRIIRVRFDRPAANIKSIEHFVAWTPNGWPAPPSKVICYTHDHKLHITAHCGDAIKRARGEFVVTNLRGPCEINCYAAVFFLNPGTDRYVHRRPFIGDVEAFDGFADDSSRFSLVVCIARSQPAVA